LPQAGEIGAFDQRADLRHSPRLDRPQAGDAGVSIVADQSARFVELGGANVPRRFAIDMDEPFELGGGNAYANPQEYLLAALNACMIVGYAALCTLQGITLEKLEITTEGDVDLRGFFGLDQTVAAGYRELKSQVVIKATARKSSFRRSTKWCWRRHPTLFNVTRAIRVMPELVVE